MFLIRSGGRPALLFGLVWLASVQTALAQIPDLGTGRIPTLAPLVKEVTLAVVNISVQGKIREDNPLYHDPFFREFFDVPKQLEKEINAAGSGVIVDAQKGYVLTANHVVAQASQMQIRTKDGRKFAAKLIGRDAATDVALLQIRDPTGLKAIALGNSDALEVGDFVIAVGNPFASGRRSPQVLSAHWGAQASSSRVMRISSRLMPRSTPVIPAEV
jgi:serine protease Do